MRHRGITFTDTITIGFHTPEQIDDVLRLMSKCPAKAVA
jgi:hypothetical protein